MFVSLHLTDVEKMAWWDVCVEMSLFCVSRPFFSRTDSIKTTVCHVRSWTLILTRIILVYTLYLFFYLLSFIAALLALSLLYISFLLVPKSPFLPFLSSECAGGVVPSEGETARSPVPCTVPGP